MRLFKIGKGFLPQYLHGFAQKCFQDLGPSWWKDITRKMGWEDRFQIFWFDCAYPTMSCHENRVGVARFLESRNPFGEHSMVFEIPIIPPQTINTEDWVYVRKFWWFLASMLIYNLCSAVMKDDPGLKLPQRKQDNDCQGAKPERSYQRPGSYDLLHDRRWLFGSSDPELLEYLPVLKNWGKRKQMM